MPQLGLQQDTADGGHVAWCVFKACFASLAAVVCVFVCRTRALHIHCLRIFGGQVAVHAVPALHLCRGRSCQQSMRCG